jgi:heat shock protein HslJ
MKLVNVLRLFAAVVGGIAAVDAPASAQTAPAALNAPVSFVGRIPGADVPYIDVTLTLNPNKSYAQRYVYAGKGKPFIDGGSWKYDALNGTVELLPVNGRDQYLRFTGPNTLTMLDAYGDPLVSKNNYSLKRAPAAIALGGAPSAAPGKGATPVPASHSLESTLWYAVYLNDHKVITTSEKATPSIKFDAKAGTVSGSGGCNRFTGKYESTAAGSLKFGPLASTRMACADTMVTESEFFKALDQVRGYHIDGNVLHFIGAKGETLVNFTPAP